MNKTRDLIYPNGMYYGTGMPVSETQSFLNSSEELWFKKRNHSASQGLLVLNAQHPGDLSSFSEWEKNTSTPRNFV